MPVYKRTETCWQVLVKASKALPDYRHIRKHFKTEAEAIKAEAEIKLAVSIYGCWPVPAGVPIRSQPQGVLDRKDHEGTIKQASRLAKQTHWQGKRSIESVRHYVNHLVHYLTTKRGLKDLAQIKSADIDAFVEDCRARKNTACTINKKLSALRVIFKVASERTPPLVGSVIHIPYVATRAKPKWWLTPERWVEADRWMRGEGGLHTLADYVEWAINTGMRVEETLRLKAEDFTGLGTERPSVQVPGTKTMGSEATVPLNKVAAIIAHNRLALLQSGGHLFPISYRVLLSDFQELKAFLGNPEGCEPRALRRTFAKLADQRGTPTAVLQRLMRHESIITTQGYLQVVGSQDMEEARKWLA